MVNTQCTRRRTHFPGYRGVFRGEIRVVGPAVHHRQGEAGGGEIRRHGLDTGLSGIGEIDGDRSAYSAGGLVHQAAGFTEVAVLGFLTHKGQFHRIEAALVEQNVEDRGCQNFQ